MDSLKDRTRRLCDEVAAFGDRYGNKAVDWAELFKILDRHELDAVMWFHDFILLGTVTAPSDTVATGIAMHDIVCPYLRERRKKVNLN